MDRPMFSKPFPFLFWFGVVLLICVAVGGISSAVGISFVAESEPKEESTDSTQDQIVPRISTVIFCEECAKKDGLITKLREELFGADAKLHRLERRQKVIEARVSAAKGESVEAENDCCEDDKVASAEEQFRSEHIEVICKNGTCGEGPRLFRRLPRFR